VAVAGAAGVVAGLAAFATTLVLFFTAPAMPFYGVIASICAYLLAQQQDQCKTSVAF
jgi:hypothetical protein